MNEKCFACEYGICSNCDSKTTREYPYWGRYGKALVLFLRPLYGISIRNGSLEIHENILNESDFEVLENVVSVELTQEIVTKTVVKHSSK